MTVALRIYICIYKIYTRQKGVSMKKAQTAKLFKNGSSQAVRLPLDFRFSGDEVYISRDETTGDVVLSNRPGAGAWKDFFDLVHSIKDSDAFMSDRPMNVLPQERGIFDDAVSNEEN